MFGVVSGLIWSLVPGTLNSLFTSPKETTVVIVSGLVSGVSTSFALRSHVSGARSLVTVIAGVVALPLGAFVFGFLLSILQWVFLAQAFTPFSIGFQYALFSMISIFAIVLWPLSVLTTFLLRAVLNSGNKDAKAA